MKRGSKLLLLCGALVVLGAGYGATEVFECELSEDYAS